MKRTAVIKGLLFALLSSSFLTECDGAVLSRPTNEGFRINQVPYGTSSRNGPAALAAVYTKRGFQAPEYVQRAVSRAVQLGSDDASSGSVPALSQNVYDVAYKCPVTLGSSQVYLDFDSGSSDLWSFSTLQPEDQTANHQLYHPSGNPIANSTWAITYLDGSSASGIVYSDSVTLGGLTFQNQYVEAAENASASFVSGGQDGLLGLGFDQLNTIKPSKQYSLFSAIAPSLPQPLFTANLKKNASGTYTFGYLNKTEYVDPITYVDVDSSDGFWSFETTAYAVGSGSSTSKQFSGIMDTGTTLLVLPSDIARSYYANVTGASFNADNGGWTFSCDADLPALHLQIGGQAHTVPGSFLNFAPAGGSACFGGLQQSDDIPFSIFGDIFIKSQFVVFDRSTTPPRLGLAKQQGVNYDE
ncbi:Peptidase A1 [Lasiodiplodia theobromae]|uniref:Peptidase A1 n=2 Tax=Lasiodiplodia theobromae TaxID=45133 RepID=A0A8H7ISI2_9PEZI|nr:Peptidase A1 [Lasiodiplodia theobromae]